MPEGDGDPSGYGDKKRKNPNESDSGRASFEENFYKPFIKQDYKRVFPDNANTGEFLVYVESSEPGENVGNRNPLVMANLFKNEVKGVTNIKRINARKVGVIFSQAINANNFIKNEDWLKKNKFKAYIPAGAVETIGVLRFVPTSISNEELFKKLSSDYEIVSVRRFIKKVNGEIKPFGSVSVTFLSRGLPECVYLDIYRFKVYEYIAPLLQCFKCFKFNHAAKVCSGTQKCSMCSEEHHYTTCSKDAIIKCINCHGAHLAISRDCPIKRRKIEEKQNRVSYASALSSRKENLVNNYNKDFPELKKSFRPKTISAPKLKPVEAVTPPAMNISSKITENKTDTSTNKDQLIDDIVNNDSILKTLVSTLVTLGNSNNKITTQVIKDILLKNLKNG